MQAKIWTLNALAVELGRDRRALAKSLEGLAPDSESKDARGRSARHWRMARVFEHLAAKPDSLSEDKSRLARAQAEKIEMENAVRKGDLAEISIIAEEFGNAVATARSLLLAIPAKIANDLARIKNAAVAESVMYAAITEVMHQLANFDPSDVHARNVAGKRKRQ